MREPSEQTFGRTQPPPAARPLMVGTINREAILGHLLANGSTTVRELARLTSLSVPAVSRTLGELLETGLVVSEGPLTGRLGRRPQGYRLADDHRHVVAIDLGQVPAVVALGTLSARLVARRPVDLRGRHTVSRELVNTVSQVAEEAGVGMDRLASVSVANPGIVDQETGTMRNAAESADWAGEPLRNELAKALRLPVLVMNDINMATLGELYHGAGRGVNDFVFLRLEMGVAAGIVQAGRLVLGANNAAGELGNLRLGGYGSPDPDARIEDRLAFAHETALDGGWSRLDPQRIAAGLGDIVGIVSALLDPAVVLLGGYLCEFLDDELLAAVEARAARHMHLPPAIRLADLGADGALVGGMALGVERYLADVAGAAQDA